MQMRWRRDCSYCRIVCKLKMQPVVPKLGEVRGKVAVLIKAAFVLMEKKLMKR